MCILVAGFAERPAWEALPTLEEGRPVRVLGRPYAGDVPAVYGPHAGRMNVPYVFDLLSVSVDASPSATP
jgi:hypothetical protein